MAPCSVHHQDPPSFHPEHGYGPDPAPHGEAAVQHNIAWELSTAGSPPHHPTQRLDQEKDGDGLLEAVEAGAWDELGLHRRAIFLIEYEVDGAEEEGDSEQDGGDQSEVEAGRDALIHPGVGDGGIGFTVALHEHHGYSWGGTEMISLDTVQ